MKGLIALDYSLPDTRPVFGGLGGEDMVSLQRTSGPAGSTGRVPSLSASRPEAERIFVFDIVLQK